MVKLLEETMIKKKMMLERLMGKLVEEGEVEEEVEDSVEEEGSEDIEVVITVEEEVIEANQKTSKRIIEEEADLEEAEVEVVLLMMARIQIVAVHKRKERLISCQKMNKLMGKL